MVKQEANSTYKAILVVKGFVERVLISMRFSCLW